MKSMENENTSSKRAIDKEQPQQHQFLLPMHRVNDSYLFSRARELDELLEAINKEIKADA